MTNRPGSALSLLFAPGASAPWLALAWLALTGLLWPAAAVMALEPETATPDLEPRETTVDDAHRDITLSVDGFARTIDGYFGDKIDFGEVNKSRLRIRTGLLLEAGERPDLDIGGNLRLVLPNAEDRLSLVIDSEDDLDSDQRRRAAGASGRGGRPGRLVDEEDGLLADLRYSLIQDLFSDFDVRVGGRFRGIRPTVFLGARYRRQWQWPSNAIDTRHDVRRFIDSGLEWQSALRFRQFPEKDVTIGQTLQFSWDEDEPGYDYEAIFSVSKRLPLERQLAFGLGVYFSTETPHELSDVVVSSSWRQPLLRPWHTIILGARIRSSQADGFDPVPGLTFGSEIMF